MHPIKSSYFWKDIFWLTLAISFIYFLFLGSVPLINPDEGRYMEIPREMLASGNFITPHLNGIIYFEKPILFYWLQAAGLKLFGMSLFAMRLPNALIAILGCLLTYFTANQLFNRKTAIFSALISATSCIYFVFAHYVATDMLLCLLFSATLFFFCLAQQEFKKTYFYLFYIASALAVLTKGLVGIFLPAVIILSWLLLTNRWKDLKYYCIPGGLLVFLAISLPWHILAQIKNPQFFHFYIVEQQFLRYLTPYAGREQAFWFLPLVFAVGFLPWTVFLPNLIIDTYKTFFSGRWQRFWQFALCLSLIKQIKLLLWLAIFILFVFYWLSKSQLISYILPLFPALAILLADYLVRAFEQQKDFTKNFLVLAFIFTLGPLVLFLIKLSPVFPHAKIYLFSAIMLFFISGWLVCLINKLRNAEVACIILVASISIAYASLYFAYGKFNRSTSLPFAEVLKPLLKPDSEVIVYNNYYQDLPVYLERTVKIVNWQGELAPGIAYTPNAEQIMINENQLWQQWQTHKEIYLLLLNDDYEKLKSLYPMSIIIKFSDRILVTNQTGT